MILSRRYIRSLCFIFSMLPFLLVQAPVMAGIVTTPELVNGQQVELDQERLQELLTRSDVQDALISQGVDPAFAQQRLSSMTDAEIQTMAANMDQLPAGGRIGTVELLLIIIIIILLV